LPASVGSPNDQTSARGACASRSVLRKRTCLRGGAERS
jgi:hypothetical protein